MNCGKKIVQLGVTGARQVSTTQVRQDSAKQIANYQKLKAKQKLFQEENGLLVHEKGGIFDKILYQTTVALCGVGLGMAGKLMYDMACPRR